MPTPKHDIPNQQPKGMPIARAIDLCVEHHGCLPTSVEIDDFAKANGISLRAMQQGKPWRDYVEEARALRAERGLSTPGAPPPLPERPDYSRDLNIEHQHPRQATWRTKDDLIDLALEFLSWVDERPGRRATKAFWDQWASEDPAARVCAWTAQKSDLRFSGIIKDARQIRRDPAGRVRQHPIEQYLKRKLSKTPLKILAFAHQHGDITIDELASSLSRARSSIGEHVEAMVEVGALVTCPPDPDDDHRITHRYRLGENLPEHVALQIQGQSQMPMGIVRAKGDHKWTARDCIVFDTLCERLGREEFVTRDVEAIFNQTRQQANRFITRLERHGAVERTRQQNGNKYRGSYRLVRGFEINPVERTRAEKAGGRPSDSPFRAEDPGDPIETQAA